MTEPCSAIEGRIGHCLFCSQPIAADELQPVPAASLRVPHCPHCEKELSFAVCEERGFSVFRSLPKRLFAALDVEPVCQMMERLMLPRAVVNFSNIHFVHSHFFRPLIKLRRQVQESSGILRFCHVGPSMLDVMKLTKFDRLFEIYADEAAALNGDPATRS